MSSSAAAAPAAMQHHAELWELHCARLPNLVATDPIVAEVAMLFEAVLAVGSLKQPDPPLRLHVFTIHLNVLNSEALTVLVEAPVTVVPLLEYLRALRHFTEVKTVCAVTLRIDATDGDASCAALPPTSYERLGTALISRLVCVSGTVVRISSPKPVCVEMSFECTSCGDVSSVPVDRMLIFPVRCAASKKCKGNFLPRTDLALCRESQTIKVQECPSLERSAQTSGNGIAKMVDVELPEGLIDTCSAGDVVVVHGILLTKPSEVKQQRLGAAHQLVVTALGLKAARHGLRGVVLHRGSGALSVPVFADHDVQRFRRAAARSGWFEQLSESLCPGIVGHTATKQALLLALFGGTPRGHTRSTIHVAIFGDPGLGKSQLLRAACAASPRGVYVSANSSSSCGLTVSLSRDANNETTFEAGAVVHGDGGVTCIDEIDKGATEHKALLEVMEQETLSIAKAGMIFSLPVRTTVLAAGNPVGGKFQPGRSITDNLNLSTALLSRFDFVFVLADEVRRSGGEGKLTERLFDLHSARSGDAGGAGGGTIGSCAPGAVIRTDELIRFTQFAKARCRPVLGDEAKAVLKAAYMSLRQSAEDGTAGQLDLPVTARQLQSLVRSAEARAKCELSDVVTAIHAQFAVDLAMRSRESRDPTSALKPPPGFAAPVVTGPGRGGKLSQRDQVAQRLRTLLAATGRDVLTRAEVLDACQAQDCKNPERMLHMLSEFGIILQQSGGRFRLKASLL